MLSPMFTIEGYRLCNKNTARHARKNTRDAHGHTFHHTCTFPKTASRNMGPKQVFIEVLYGDDGAPHSEIGHHQAGAGGAWRPALPGPAASSCKAVRIWIQSVELLRGQHYSVHQLHG